MKRLLSALLVAVLAILSLPLPSQAAGASLYLSPATGTFLTESTFDLSVYVNTGGQDVNAVQVDLHFPADKLQVVSPSVGNSFVSIWLQSPTYNNQSGTVNLSGGLPNPGIRGSAALVTTISFRAKAPGTAKITFDNSSDVLANDGSGTNILGSKLGATLTLKVPPPNGPLVTSPTNPDQTAWYKGDSATVEWEKDDKVTDFSFVLDQDPATVPDETSEGGMTSQSYTEVPEGINYFHLRAKNANSWGGTTHFKIQIDKTGPAKFTPTIYPGPKTARRQPLVNFFTTDNLAGIDHYEVRVIDHNQAEADSLFTEQTSPYKLPSLNPGKYTIVVRALGKAGNYTDGTAELEIVPQILPFNEDVVGFLEVLPITNLVLIALILGSIAASVVVRIRRHRTPLTSKVSANVSEIQRELQAVKEKEAEIAKLREDIVGTLSQMESPGQTNPPIVTPPPTTPPVQ